MPRALKTCSVVGCPELVSAGRCDSHKREAEARRGTAAQRGYGHRHEEGFRKAVLWRDPFCRCEAPHRTHCGGYAASTVADHHPRDRRELARLGLNPNDPRYGRGLCASCHGYHTSQAQPGGWNAR